MGPRRGARKISGRMEAYDAVIARFNGAAPGGAENPKHDPY